MPGTSFNARSLRRLDGVHSDLVLLVMRAAELCTVPFQVVEGARTLATQRIYVRRGASQTMKSRHLTGHAVDLAPWAGTDFDWHNEAGYEAIRDAMKAASKELSIPVEWGGDWKSFHDSPHFQLPWKNYPVGRNNGKPLTERDLIAMGSRTAKTARQVRQVGKALVATGIGVATTLATDPVGTATVAVETVAQTRTVTEAAREQAHWLANPLNLVIMLAVAGLLIWRWGGAISAYRVEDQNGGKHVGRGDET